MGEIITSYNPGGVDDAVLTGTGQGGLLSDGYLRDEPLESYLGTSETAVFVLSNSKRGVSYEHEQRDESGAYRPGDGYRAFALVTDTRLLFVIGDNQSDGEANGDGDHSISVPLTDIELVDGTDGVLSGELTLVTAADMRWRFPCKQDLDAVVEYLDVASMTWMKLESRMEAARMDIVDATQHLESREYDAAMDSVRDAMAETDAARRHEREFCEEGVHAMSARIEKTEQRIRDLRLEILRARATHNIDAGERHWRADEYDEAYRAYNDAHDDYVEALAIRDPDFEESEELRDKLARVERNMSYLEQAPIDSAEEARERAAAADDHGERADHLETALERYRTALELDWGQDLKRFECDTEAVRSRIDDVATDLVAARQAEAAAHVAAANDHYDAGRHAEARESYQAGRDALRAMLDVARELVPETATEVADRLDAIDERLDDIDARLDDARDHDEPHDAPEQPDAGWA